ncbi:MAG: response regulator transcription factor [Anaerolineae bacterium]|nr:response regulator transcription factor [Anaerolineae bacterium]MDK1081331.1 response regulator transcription factor [Anaerolineae bacterium]MDK1118578.1 response regulator transcription factor [Anaerolineae bacterium]
MNKILLIDDDPTLLHLLGEFLEGDKFEVIGAESGKAGLRLAYDQQPNLILLDVMMPGMDGWEVCARLREMSDVPIIMLTAKTTEPDKLRGFRLGVDDYVIKPFSFEELTARIGAVLTRTKSNDSNKGYIVYGGITLDTERYQAYFNEKPLNLTPTEYRLLEALVRRKGKVASEHDLMQEVWGNYRSHDSGMVRRYILMLRKKIEIDHSNPKKILTVRGFGYRVAAGRIPKPEG